MVKCFRLEFLGENNNVGSAVLKNGVCYFNRVSDSALEIFFCYVFQGRVFWTRIVISASAVLKKVPSALMPFAIQHLNGNRAADFAVKTFGLEFLDKK